MGGNWIDVWDTNIQSCRCEWYRMYFCCVELNFPIAFFSIFPHIAWYGDIPSHHLDGHSVHLLSTLVSPAVMLGNTRASCIISSWIWHSAPSEKRGKNLPKFQLSPAWVDGASLTLIIIRLYDWQVRYVVTLHNLDFIIFKGASHVILRPQRRLLLVDWSILLDVQSFLVGCQGFYNADMSDNLQGQVTQISASLLDQTVNGSWTRGMLDNISNDGALMLIIISVDHKMIIRHTCF